ncbi:MAG TPA: hypothetical protein DDW41_02515 [Candidatus Andersenbacteria bacterium]|nr:hypothetical protein [Candidatus Andersenbacteria bacterium]
MCLLFSLLVNQNYSIIHPIAPAVHPPGFAFHVAYQVQDKTMNDAEVTRLHQEVGEALLKELQAKLR